MAGDNHMLRTDPAIERWQLMRDNQYLHFKWTPLKTRQAIRLLVVVPALVGVLAWSTDNRWDWVSKRKGESLLRKPPPAPAPSAEDK